MKFRRPLTVLIVLVALAGVFVAVAATFAGAEDRTSYVQSGAVRRIEVDVEAGRVAVVAGEGPEARVERTSRYIVGAPVVSETLVDGVLRVSAECRGLVAVGCGVDYRLEVPAAVQVRVRTDRASVHVEGISGMVDVETEAGSVRLAGSSGPVRAVTSAGDIEGVDLAPEFVDATTTAGRIRLSLAEASARVDLRTGAGSIDLALPDAPGGYRVATDTGAGDVDVSADVNQDPGAGRSVTARTGAGNIRIRSR